MRLRTKQQEGTSVAANEARAEEPAIAAAASKYDDTLRKIFYDARDGFGSIEKTWKAAKKQHPEITKAIVKDFLDRQKIRQKKKIRNGIPGFLGKHSRQFRWILRICLRDCSEQMNINMFCLRMMFF